MKSELILNADPYTLERQETERTPQHIFLDDEPLEHILYGEQGNSSRTLMNLYLSGAAVVQTLEDACCDRRWDLINLTVEKLRGLGDRLSTVQHFSIVSALDSILPNCPKPLPVRFDPAAMVELLKMIWDDAIFREDKALENCSGPHLMLMQEYLGNYEDACTVAKRIWLNRIQKGNPVEQASATNNLGFNYLQQQKWPEAIDLFNQAAAQYKALGMEFNYANSYANYLHCQLEMTGRFDDIAETKIVLESLDNTLRQSGRWYARKPLILKARLEEQLGNYRKAMLLAARAIRSARGSGTAYQKEDWDYLKNLWGIYRQSCRGQGSMHQGKGLCG